jgi:hypothetical protein
MFVDGVIVTAAPRERLSPGLRGVRKHIPRKCYGGYTMFSTAFGATEYLIDMNGMIVHTWPVEHSQYAELLPNGNIMADNYGSSIYEVTPKGERVWSWEGPYHHDFHIVDDDQIVMLLHAKNDPLIPGFSPEDQTPQSLQSDVVVAVNRKGDVLWEFPFRDHVQELHDLAGMPLPTRYARLDSNGKAIPYPSRDWAHTNTIEVLPETPLGRKDERFRAGNILFSFRSLDIIGVADVEKNKIVWAWGLGVLDGQHQPIMTPQGTILIFDNGTARGYSAAVEIDPSTDTEVWRYEDRAGFFSAYRAGVQRLPNGNTLIAESDAGRIFEVTPEKEIVWDYYHPFLSQPAGSQGLHVYRATRYSHEQADAVFESRKDEGVTAVSSARHTPVNTYDEAVKFYRDGLGG